MINLLRIILVIMLFIVIRISISKFIGKKVRKEIFSELEVNKEIKAVWHIKKSLIRNLLVFCGMFILAVLNGYNIFLAILIGVGAISILYSAKAIKSGFYKKQVLQDLLNISECLRVQISAQIPLGNALRALPNLCKNKEFSNLITNMYLEYELSKFVIVDSAENLQSKFNYPEIRIFISVLNQQIQGTSAIEAFDNLINVLKEKYIEFLEEATKSKIAIMTMGVFGIVINVAALGIYPVAVEAFNAINVMLK